MAKIQQLVQKDKLLKMVLIISLSKRYTFVSGKICEIFGINFRELAVFAFLARINFREFMI